jgi:hypothetical protein
VPHSLFARLRSLLILISVLAFSTVIAALHADEPPVDKTGEKKADIAPPTDKELADKRVVFMKTALAHFTIQVGDRKEPAKVGDPCLRWTNPIGTGGANGIVAVYAYNGGRPDAIGKFFIDGQKRLVNEFTIIPESDVKIMRSDRLFWKPSEFVCKFTDLPNSPVPAAKPTLRLSQMRTIAADFSVTDYFGTPETKHEMRLLSQPVYRYSEEGKILDGSLFVFVIGTDPECCLLVEAYRDDKGSRYRYAVAPMAIFKLEARYKDTAIWNIERRMVFGDNCRSYYANGYTREPGETLPE